MVPTRGTRSTDRAENHSLERCVHRVFQDRSGAGGRGLPPRRGRVRYPWCSTERGGTIRRHFRRRRWWCAIGGRGRIMSVAEERTRYIMGHIARWPDGRWHFPTLCVCLVCEGHTSIVRRYPEESC